VELDRPVLRRESGAGTRPGHSPPLRVLPGHDRFGTAPRLRRATGSLCPAVASSRGTLVVGRRVNARGLTRPAPGVGVSAGSGRRPDEQRWAWRCSAPSAGLPGVRGYAIAPRPADVDGAAAREDARQPRQAAPRCSVKRFAWGHVWGQVAAARKPREHETRLLERASRMGRGGFEPPTNGL
jgi:hypothetical protein